MVNTSNIELIIQFDDPDLDPESDPDDKDEMNQLTQNLYKQVGQFMEDLDEEGAVRRVRETEVPELSKPVVGEFIVGILTAEVNWENIIALMRFVGHRLSGKTIEMKVEANGKRLEVKASSEQELLIAIQAAQKFIAASKEDTNG
ncbi:MAG: hypothetical protein F6K41_30250 [Symploca sp. SIO3E6]|nr:hypothetical protein [Caldora sp. SIO3E6]